MEVGEMRTAILLDGEPNPIAMRMDTASKFIATPHRGVVANFEYMPSLSDDKVLIYRRTGIDLTKEQFESLAHKEADPYRRPKAYKNINRETLVQ